MIEVIPNCTKAYITAPAPIPAIVTAICIKGENFVTYELSWIYEGTSKSAWFQPIEFTTEKIITKPSIGFKP